MLKSPDELRGCESWKKRIDGAKLHRGLAVLVVCESELLGDLRDTLQAGSKMDDPSNPLRIPPEMSVYADKHNILLLVQSMVSNLLVNRPDDPIPYLMSLLQRRRVDVPRVMLLGPPAVGKHTVAKRLSAELRAVHLTLKSILQEAEGTQTQQPLDVEFVARLIQRRVKQPDCFSAGWVLEGFPQTRLQALSLQQAGVLPQHVVMLTAPDDVLVERHQGRLLDPLTGEVYHETFVWPTDGAVAQRLQKSQSLSQKQMLAELRQYRCEVTGVSSAYQHVFKVVNGDQPLIDVYQQVLAFVHTRRCYRTPRILLLGPPGSGKSHQAKLLADKYKMVDVCCGQMLRSAAASGSDVGDEIQSYLDVGRPVPDLVLIGVLEERLSRVDCSCRGWILHGFPQNLEQAQILKRSQLQPNRVFFLELTDEVCLERVSLRSTDPVSGKRYHAVTRPAPTNTIQGRLMTRPEDSSQSVTHTLGLYRKNTAALQSVFPDAINIDADQDPHTVFEALESRLTTE